MLQYPIQLPPLSLSSSPKNSPLLLSTDYFRSNDSTTVPSPRLHSTALNKRLPKDSFGSRPAFTTILPPTHHAIPLPISTNFAASSTSSSPSTASSKLPRSPYLSSFRLPTGPVSPPIAQPWSAKQDAFSSRPSSISSSITEDVLAPGDVVGEGARLQGELIRLVSIGSTSLDYKEPAKEFEVVRRLGTGSYAVVYLVREVLYRPPPSEDGHTALMGPMELDGSVTSLSVQYGREYAIKCLSKANLDEEALAAQMSEVTIHQSLLSHPNIVTLHSTLETSSFLLLLLEFVPGEDLFYFLEQSRDHYETDPPSSTDSLISTSRTPPTPSLLSNLHPSQLLSRTRLRLISSMFSQMCDAVAACHAQQVFHRDIKPENFIVTDGWTTLPDGRRERKVIVKLTDFGLSTTDIESSDMDCGSAPYMSYECRNNVAPTYGPRAADVWSLGIVLINMLYHYNPWTDTTQSACSSFDLFRQQPVNFFLQRFAGMTRPVAEFLANKVFCILEDPKDDSQRVSASEFGAWARDLPSLFCDKPGLGHQRGLSTSSTQGHLISSTARLSHRPCSRHPSIGTPAMRTPALRSSSLSRPPSLGPAAFEMEPSELSTVFDQEFEEQEEHADVEAASRTTSNNKRRKRGARKGKGSAVPPVKKDETLETLAVASQSLAREISKASRSPSASRKPKSSFEPPPLPTALTIPQSPLPASASPTVSKKPSKWKLSFGKGSAVGRVSPVEEASASSEYPRDSTSAMSATATNVTNLLMGLNAPPPSPPSAPRTDSDNASTWSRGRRSKAASPGPPPSTHSSRSRGRSGQPHSPVHAQSPHASVERWAHNARASERAVSPASTRSGRPLASSASSMSSGNWRSSMSSSAGTSTSGFTRYSNASMRSVDTAATSVSSSSWRTHGKPGSPPSHGKVHPPPVPPIPKNIKLMTGVPWELDELPRQMQSNPDGYVFASPPVRKQRMRKPKDAHLDTISERPAGGGFVPKSPPPPPFVFQQRQDAATSTTDLSGAPREDGEGPKKVPKAQINALAKMLSALRR
jgi:serine/threonine protein kinase